MRILNEIIFIVFDNSNETHIYRGVYYIDNNKIEYFEKSINDLYLSVDNDIKEKIVNLSVDVIELKFDKSYWIIYIIMII